MEGSSPGPPTCSTSWTSTPTPTAVCRPRTRRNPPPPRPPPGAAALIDELSWLRLLGHVFGSTTAATATLLSAYLFGLGLGAYLFGRISDRSRRAWALYVAAETGIGLYGLASNVLLQRSAALYAAVH